MLHISGTIRHMIFIYGTHVQKDNIFRGFFRFFFFCLILGVNSGVKRQKIMSVTLHISGNIHHMIMIFGTHV